LRDFKAFSINIAGQFFEGVFYKIGLGKRPKIAESRTLIMKTINHILKTTAGVTCEMTFDETTGAFACEWSPPPPFTAAVRSTVIAEYLPWRDSILAEWSKRTGKRVAVVNL
jgi:hypothetical protein